jgi:hypothetical protein
VYRFIEIDKEERILWIDKDYSYCYTIDLNIDKLNINARKIVELERHFSENKLVYIGAGMTKAIAVNYASDKAKRLLDSSWEIIKPIIANENEPYIFNNKYRSEIIKKTLTDKIASKATIYKYLRKYWQGGKVKSALLSEYSNCGGRGKEKKLGDKKVGRKNSLAYLFPDKVGINLTDKDKKVIRDSIEKFYRNKKEISLMQAYKLMINEYYSEKYVDENGDLIEKVLLPHTIPTYYQFKNLFYKERDIKLDITGRKGQKEFDLNHSNLPSNAKYYSFGPGYLFEIDSTICPIYLVNRINKKGIGKPVVYFVEDVFTTLIAGIFVGVGYACYEGAASALYNCTENKVEFCKHFGIDITNNDWPVTGLCMNLRADRGELVAKLPEKIIENLRIGLETTASFMAKMKGTIEGNFHLQESKFKPYLEGVIRRDFRKRGGSNYVEDANMTVEEFTKVLIRCVIHHNNRVMKNFQLTQGMVNEDINPIPVSIWDWGTKHISGNFRFSSDEDIKLNLMRSGKATITEKGIRFCKRHYRCDLSIHEDWHTKARNCGYWEVDVRFDPRCLDKIYIINVNSSKFECCYLKDEETIYFNRTFEEITYFQINEKNKLLALRDIENQNDLRLHIGLKEDSKKAKKKIFCIKKEDLVKNIIVNKREENIEYSRQQALSIIDNKNTTIDSSSNKKIGNEKARESLLDRIESVN